MSSRHLVLRFAARCAGLGLLLGAALSAGCSSSTANSHEPAPGEHAIATAPVEDSGPKTNGTALSQHARSWSPPRERVDLFTEEKIGALEKQLKPIEVVGAKSTGPAASAEPAKGAAEDKSVK